MSNRYDERKVICKMQYAHVLASEFTVFNENVPALVCEHLIAQDTRSKGTMPSFTERIQTELFASPIIQCRLVIDGDKIKFFDVKTGDAIAEQDSVFEEIHPGL